MIDWLTTKIVAVIWIVFIIALFSVWLLSRPKSKPEEGIIYD